MICELVLKCATLIVVIHGLRLVGRRIGPRASGLILGLPSSTAILLVLCGREKGMDPAIEMADAGLLGLIAAVSLPLAFAQAVRWGWKLPAVLAAAVGAYVAVASGLGFVHPAESSGCLMISCGSILAASYVASRIGMPDEATCHTPPSRRWTAAVRTLIPSAYVLIVGMVSIVGDSRVAGMVSTFPSMSMVLLAVTHLEDGAASASRIARTLPAANLSTVAFLAAFRFGCPGLGLAWGTLCGYLAALLSLAAMEWAPRSLALRCVPTRLARGAEWLVDSGLRTSRTLRSGPRIHVPTAAHPLGRLRAPHRRPFAPRVEILPC
jgi:hypothetical protein